MGQEVSLYRVDSEEIAAIEDLQNRHFDHHEELGVGDVWQILIFILSEGDNKKRPYNHIFMPRNMFPNNDSGDCSFISYHDELDVAVILSGIEHFDEEKIRNMVSSIPEEKFYRYCASDANTERLVILTFQVIEFFSRAKADGDCIIASHH